MGFDTIDLLHKAGPVGVVIVVLSAVALAATIFKTLQFAIERVGSHRTARRAIDRWLEGDHGGAYEAVEHHRAPLSQVVAHAMRGLTHGGSRIETVKEDVGRVATESLRRLRKYLRLIELIGQLAPLLGLLGTVIGMIQAFNNLQQSGAVVNPATLAGGIWTALLTTALGLAVAIVFSSVTVWFDARLEGEASAMETTLTGFFAARITEDQLRDFNEVTIVSGGKRAHAN